MAHLLQLRLGHVTARRARRRDLELLYFLIKLNTVEMFLAGGMQLQPVPAGGGELAELTDELQSLRQVPESPLVLDSSFANVRCQLLPAEMLVRLAVDCEVRL